ncbi:MAG: hypothetical protein P4L40_18825 [Terracidiphilus sp.]|nr:hypothetical protein [Terracidiphilus sp.]
MSLAFSDDRAKAETGTSARRLDGWKTIASYLDKAERTVKRWEADRGLPIHRVPGGGRAAVYAIASELDAWLESNRTYEGESLNFSELESEGSNHSGAAATLDREPDQDTRQGTNRVLSFLRERAQLLTMLGILVVGLVAVAFHFGGILSKRLGSINRMQTTGAHSGTASTLEVSDAEKNMARDLYLQGRFEWNKRTPESLNRALDDFTQSIVHDPSNARTYAGLADTYLLLHEYSLMSDRESESRAIAAAKKAVELDDSLAEAHRSLAFAEVWGNWDFRAGEKEFRRAIELDPRAPLTHLWFATAFNTPEWYRVTANEFDRAQELDPTSPVILSNKSIWLFEMGHRQAGIDLAHQVERDNPDFAAPHRYLARMNWDIHDYSAFLAETEKTADIMHDQVLKATIANARSEFRRDGERGMLDALYLARKKLYLDGKLAGTPLAEVCIRLGLRDEAVQLIQHDYDQHRAEFLWILAEPEFATLKSDQRYMELLKKLNFPAPPSMAQ